MQKGKTIKFIKHQELKKDHESKTANLMTYYWTTVNDKIVSNSSSLDEAEARQFYDKVCELNGETEIQTVLDTTTYHSPHKMKEHEAN